MKQAKMMTWEIPENEQLLAAVGTIALRHSQLDYVLRLTIKTVANLELEEALAATEFEGSAALRRQISKLAKRKLGEGETLLRLQAILEWCRQATDKRNRLVHEVWGKELDGGHGVRNSDHSWDAVPSLEELYVLAEKLVWLRDTLNTARLEGFLREALEDRAKQSL